ncbi:MAG: flagellar basal body rod C-terminal domain-containing protein, partial [Ruminiclostridium sp.]
YETIQEETNIIDYNTLEDMIGVYSVPNNYGLMQSSANHFLVTQRSGEAAPNPDSRKLRTYLEMSTVDLASEMVHIIESQRAYQLNAKIVQTADEMQSIANNLRG